ncbi:hypothetical protein [Neobacillus bataviensis]|uniref:hypothetical protein n=1 Tax=Neobacillus bataviensis TaxID=220685 RepID=UPI001CBEBE42|nr:hypothetical protein [Neobacillus bataviensis]
MSTQKSRIEVTGASKAQYDEILTLEALSFIEEFKYKFRGRLIELLQWRVKFQREIGAQAYAGSS